jgi:hypothetical protein
VTITDALASHLNVSFGYRVRQGSTIRGEVQVWLLQELGSFFFFDIFLSSTALEGNQVDSIAVPRSFVAFH